MVARKNLAESILLYTTDFNSPVRRFDLDNPPEEGTIYENSQLIPEQSLPKIDFDGFEEGVGSLQNGVYQFVTRYRTDEGRWISRGQGTMSDQ